MYSAFSRFFFWGGGLKDDALQSAWHHEAVTSGNPAGAARIYGWLQQAEWRCWTEVYLFELNSQLAPTRAPTLSSDTDVRAGPGEGAEAASSRCYHAPSPLFIYKCPRVWALVLHSNLHNQCACDTGAAFTDSLLSFHISRRFIPRGRVVWSADGRRASATTSLTVNKWSERRGAKRSRRCGCCTSLVHHFKFTPCSKMTFAH